MDITWARESACTGRLDYDEFGPATVDRSSSHYLRCLVHTFECRLMVRLFACRQVSAVLPSPPLRAPLPSWDHHLRVTLCHVTHRTRDVVIEQVSGVVGLKISRQVMCQIETSIATGELLTGRLPNIGHNPNHDPNPNRHLCRIRTHPV